MMPEVFGKFFKDFGRAPADYYALRRLNPSYRVYFKDGESLDTTTDCTELCRRFEAVEAGAGEALEESLAAANRTYEVSMEKFVYTDRPRFRDWIRRDVLEAGPIGLELWGDLDAYTRKFFDSQKLRQVVHTVGCNMLKDFATPGWRISLRTYSRQYQYAAVFLGGSPKKTPRLYHMMSHIDLTRGGVLSGRGVRWRCGCRREPGP